MEPFDSIEKLITEHGSAAILREHIALLKEQMTAKAAKIKELEVLLKHTETKLDDYKRQVDRFQDEKPADRCPFCRRTTGQLTKLDPHPVFHFQGWKVAHYKCSNPQCGKTYDKNLEG